MASIPKTMIRLRIRGSIWDQLTSPTVSFFSINGMGIKLKRGTFIVTMEGHRTMPTPILLLQCRTGRSRNAVSVGIGRGGLHMRLYYLIFLLVLIGHASLSEAAERRPDAAVRKLYREVVVRRPLGIPTGAGKRAIWHFLSKQLIRTLETAQACEDDYFRQHPNAANKPDFAWLESGLFSGANEKAIPAEAVVERTEP